MGKKQIAAVMITVLLMALISGMLLLLLSVITFRMDLSASFVRVAVKAVYLVSALAGGVFIGKAMGEKKYLWGLAAGSLYFLILLLVSIILGRDAPDIMNILIALVLTAPAGMIGGMIG